MNTPTNTHPLDHANVGDGATWSLYTDRKAGTIVKRSAKRITIRLDAATLLNGPDSGEDDALVFTPGGFAGHISGTPRYRYEDDPEGRVLTFSRRVRKNGQVVWKLVGTDTHAAGNSLDAGRHHFYDYNF